MTREEAIKWLEETEFGGKMIGDKKVIEVCNMAIAALREQEERRWIPVTERLPEPMQHIIAVGQNFPWLERPGPVLDTFVYNPDAYQPWMEHITHWMPWPGFPKEVQ